MAPSVKHKGVGRKVCFGPMLDFLARPALIGILVILTVVNVLAFINCDFPFGFCLTTGVAFTMKHWLCFQK